MLATGTHVLIRVRDGITLNRAGDFLPDGSYPRRRGDRPLRLQGQARRPARPPPGDLVHPREISFTAARRAVITTTRAGTATASLPAPAITANSRDY